MIEEVHVKLKKLVPEAIIPTYAHEGDIGMDMYATSIEYDEEKDMFIYHTGLALETDMEHGILLFPRSSNRNTELYLANHVGIADTAIYRGEIVFSFKCRDSLKTVASTMASALMIDEMAEGTDPKEAAILARELFRAILHEKDHTARSPYKVGDRVGQMVPVSRARIVIDVEDELSKTERGTGGHGSTGK